MTYPTLRQSQERHRECRERGQSDPNPTWGWLMPSDETTGHLDTDVCGENVEADRNQLLRTPLSPLGPDARAGEKPDDHESGKRLDEGVEAESDERDGRGDDSRAERDTEFDEVPGDPTPGKPTRLPLKSRAISCNRNRAQLGCLHTPSLASGQGRNTRGARAAESL